MNPNPNKIKGHHLFKDEIAPLFYANLNATDFIIINQGGTWSGKSEAIMRVLFCIAIVNPNFIITVVTDTVPKLKEDALRIALNINKRTDVEPFIDNYHATDRKITFTNGSEISFKSVMDTGQAHGEKRDILYVTEATRITYSIFQQLYLRTRHRVFVDYNPTDEFYIHNKVLANPIEYPSVKLLRSWHVHNPYISQDQHDRIERISDVEMWKVYARGLTGKLRGTVYKSWECVDTRFEYRNGVIHYVDWGFSAKQTADPLAAGRIMVNPPEYPHLDYLVDELIYAQGISPSHVATVFKEEGYQEGQLCFCDHSNDSIYELQLHGITGALPAIKGPGSLLSGILFLKRKNIGYTKRSTNIETELRKYKFMEIEGIVTNTPIDEYNHHMDGIRYGIHSNALVLGNVA